MQSLAQILLPLLGAVAGEPPVPSTSAPARPEAQSIELLAGRSVHIKSAWPVAGASLTDPEVADVNVVMPELVLVSGLGSGTTDLVLWSEDGSTQEYRVSVRVDVAGLKASLEAMFPGASLVVEESGSVILLRGVLARAEQAQQLRNFMEERGGEFVDQTSIPGVQQVQVKVRVAEVSRTCLRSLGVNGFGTGSDFFFGNVVGPSNGGPVNPVNIGPPAGSSAAGNAPFVFNDDVNVSPAVTVFAGLPRADLEVFFKALVENQYLRLLAEPNLVALSGEEASFLAGGEFPIPVVQGGAIGSSSSVTIEYKEFGIALKIRPVVLGEGGIRLQVASEVSDLSDMGSVELQGFRVPAVVTRRTQTAVELKSGQTFAMSGLMSHTTGAIASKVPGLGSLPILGTLFRSVSYRKGETELVVLVTANLVEPLSQVDFLPLPGEEHVEPSDWELYSEGRLEGGRPPKLAFSTARWLKEQRLDRLAGPGPWASHDEPAPRSRGIPGAVPPGHEDGE